MTSATLAVPAIHTMALVAVSGAGAVVAGIWAGLIVVGLIAVLISNLRRRWERRGKPPDPKPEQRRQEFEEMMAQAAGDNAGGTDGPAAS